MVAVEVVRLDVSGFVDGDSVRGFAPVHQVVCHLGLPVDEHALAAGEAVQVDTVAAIVEGEVEPVMRQAFAMHAFADACFVQHRGSPFFQHPGGECETERALSTFVPG